MKNHAGFTLLELLVVLIVAAMTIGMGVPSMQTLVLNNRQAGAANELMASLHYARSEALTRNVRITLCPSSTGVDCQAVGWQEGWIVFIDVDEDRNVDGGETVLGVGEGLESVVVTSGDFGGFLMYRPNGRVMVNSTNENTGQFTLCDKRGADHARVAIIDMTGRPRVSDRQSDGSAPVCP